MVGMNVKPPVGADKFVASEVVIYFGDIGDSHVIRQRFRHATAPEIGEYIDDQRVPGEIITRWVVNDRTWSLVCDAPGNCRLVVNIGLAMLGDIGTRPKGSDLMSGQSTTGSPTSRESD